MSPLVMAYLEKLPHANSGSGGHNATLQAALACKRFGLSPAETWEAMQWFNDNRCTPRWSERELRHKVASVSALAIQKPLGQTRHLQSRARAFQAPERPVHRADPRPIARQSAQAEELFWQRVAAGLGTTLEVFDHDCGL